MRRMRKNWRVLGSSADLPDMWRHTLLRQFAESSRRQTRTRHRPSSHRFRSTRRTLVVLLSGRCVYELLNSNCAPRATGLSFPSLLLFRFDCLSLGMNSPENSLLQVLKTSSLDLHSPGDKASVVPSDYGLERLFTFRRLGAVCFRLRRPRSGFHHS